jgi:hypothetical protein
MNRGYFTISQELLKDPSWQEIEPVIKANFQEVERKERAYGFIEIHGYSHLFHITPTEGATQQYVLWFRRTDDKLEITHAEVVQ